MVMRLYDTDILLEKEYPDFFSPEDGGVKESVVSIDLPPGRAYYKEIYFEGVHIGYGNAKLSRRVIMNFESDFETVEMHFALRGSSTATADSLKSGIHFDGNQHNLMYSNRLRGEMHWKSADFLVFEINFSPGLFRKYLPDDSAYFSRFRRCMEDGSSTLLNPANGLISLPMYRVMDEIMQCNRTGVIKRMFLEAKVIELLVLQLEQLPPGRPSGLKKTDIEKMYGVREYILAHINEICSLSDLARAVGTNEFTLKKGFRDLFGTTVFGFWSDARMEQARRMLTGGEMKVNEVSDLAGYKNPRHFSAAFKKKYGVLPSAVR